MRWRLRDFQRLRTEAWVCIHPRRVTLGLDAAYGAGVAVSRYSKIAISM
ncbi:MAG: hypothetical protein ICV76_04440 [Nitrospiraceae bacterium]|nr:hypothetical protein [Nitrospiraceae bacterium]